MAHFQIVLGQKCQSLMYDKLVSYLKLASIRNGILFLTIVTEWNGEKCRAELDLSIGNWLDHLDCCLLIVVQFWFHVCSIHIHRNPSGSDLKSKVVALDHGLSVILLQCGFLRLLHLSLKLWREHVIHTVDRGVDLDAQLESLILKRQKMFFKRAAQTKIALQTSG